MTLRPQLQRWLVAAPLQSPLPPPAASTLGKLPLKHLEAVTPLEPGSWDLVCLKLCAVHFITLWQRKQKFLAPDPGFTKHYFPVAPVPPHSMKSSGSRQVY